MNFIVHENKEDQLNHILKALKDFKDLEGKAGVDRWTDGGVWTCDVSWSNLPKIFDAYKGSGAIALHPYFGVFLPFEQVVDLKPFKFSEDQRVGVRAVFVNVGRRLVIHHMGNITTVEYPRMHPASLLGCTRDEAYAHATLLSIVNLSAPVPVSAVPPGVMAALNKSNAVPE